MLPVTSAVRVSHARKEDIVLDSGIPAPAVVLPDHDGITFDLTAQRGHWVLLWWYPKADTPG